MNKAGPLSALGAAINAINRDNGWYVLVPEDWREECRVPAVLSLIHSEVSEALEAFRQNDLANFREELADALIRILNVADGMKIDMDVEVESKLAKNKTRGFRHGGKRI